MTIAGFDTQVPIAGTILAGVVYVGKQMAGMVAELNRERQRNNEMYMNTYAKLVEESTRRSTEHAAAQSALVNGVNDLKEKIGELSEAVERQRVETVAAINNLGALIKR